MRNLIVCCDGTWCKDDQKTPTNVARLRNAVDVDNSTQPQLLYYHPGVGSEEDWLGRAEGGIFGAGLNNDIERAYQWLASHYQTDDRIFLFGFSRGAFTVRSIASMISVYGLLDLTNIAEEEEIHERVARAFQQGYREKNSNWANPEWKFHGNGQNVKIYCLGVWDTVGALGVPDAMPILNLLDNIDNYNFHGTKLNDGIENARHAVALDEMRASFSPTLWTDIPDDRKDTVKQVWFPGSHGDVGGGTIETGLSDGALKWMIEEARELGLVFRDNMVEQVKPNYQDVLHDSVTSVYKYLRTQPRNCPFLDPDASKAFIDQSVAQRQKNPPISQAAYRPSVLLKPGESKQIPIVAKRHWNETGIYLEKGGEYQFEASGHWVDETVTCGPEGFDADIRKSVGYIIGDFLGQIEAAYKKLTQNEAADFQLTKREESAPWFALIGAIANGGNPAEDGTPAAHETFPIRSECSYTPTESGYLYGFANDCWQTYGNNSGSVMLNVTRLN